MLDKEARLEEEIARLTQQRDEERAEVERLKAVYAECERALLEKLVATRQAIDDYFDSRTEYTYRELVAARDDIAAIAIK